MNAICIWVAMETWILVMCYQVTNFSGNKGYFCECRYVCYNKKLFNLWTPWLKSEGIKHMAIKMHFQADSGKWNWTRVCLYFPNR